MKRFSVAFLNTRSLIPHFSDLKEHVTQNCYDVIGVSETWLRPEVPDNIININGYNVVRRDRHARGGGVALYIRSNFKFSVRFSSSEIYLEEIWVELETFRNKYIVGVFYRPPKGGVPEFLNILEQRLSDFQPHEIICGGDINLDLLNFDSKYTHTFYDYIDSLNLQQIVKEPTRVTNTCVSLLDVILVSNDKNNFESGVKDTGISDHFLTFYNFQHNEENITKKFKFRNLKGIDRDLLHNFLNMTPFEDIVYLGNVNLKVAALNDYLINIFNVLAPITQVTSKNKNPPWLTYTIKSMIRLKNKAYSKYKNTKSDADWDFYKQIKNRTNIAIRQEKKQYLQNTIDNEVNNTRSFWSKINRLNIHSTESLNQLPKNLRDPDQINQHLLALSSNHNPVDPDLIAFYNNNLKFEITTPFQFYTVSVSVIREYLFEIKSLATGADQINLDMILLCIDRIVPFITNIVNSCLLENIFPDAWKISKILPLPKRQNIEDYNDIRPISILPVLSKVIEKVMNVQIREFLNAHNILPNCQSGFRPGYSCATALLSITDDIIEAADKGLATILVLIDYSKAFDRLNHDLLISILHYIGFDMSAITLMISYLSNRMQFVETCDGVSSVSSQNCGVPQGSILGPLLFCIYTCNIISCINYCKVHLYADDTQLYISFPPENFLTAQDKINEDLSHLIDFSNKHKLHINASKTTFIVFGKNHESISSNVKIKIDTDEISVSHSCRNLGLYFDSSLRFKPHVNKCIKAAYANLKKIFPHRHILTKSQKIQLTDSLVLSHFNFADVVYGPCLDTIDKIRIQRVQKSCLRFIYGIRRREPVSHKLREAKWLSMEDRRKLHAATLFHSIIIFNRPSYLTNKIRYRTDVHALNLRYRGYISPPPHSTTFYERSFSYNIYMLYNGISEQFKALSVGAFKIKFKKFLFDLI